MPVYLDPMVDHGKRIGRAGPRWCHMIADTLDELHKTAECATMRRSWFQADARVPHYDIGSDRVRQLAIEYGAIECDRSTFVNHMRRIREKRL
jgi:hypothetical protein